MVQEKCFKTKLKLGHFGDALHLPLRSAVASSWVVNNPFK